MHTMDVHSWETPIEAKWHKANKLVEVSTGLDELLFRIIEEISQHIWSLQFSDVRAFKLYTEDCAQWSKQPLSPDAGFFIITGSPWFNALGLGEIDPDSPESATHFVVCCNEGIVEIAAHSCSFTS